MQRKNRWPQGRFYYQTLERERAHHGHTTLVCAPIASLGLPGRFIFVFASSWTPIRLQSAEIADINRDRAASPPRDVEHA